MLIINSEKIHSILMGRKVRKYCILEDTEEWSIREPRISEITETLERVKIGEFDLPLLSEKDEIFLSKQGVYTSIQKVTIGTDGNIYYNVSYVVECIDDTDKTREKLLPELNYAKQKYNERKKQEELEEQKEQELMKKQEIKVKQIKEWQQNNIDKIRGIIIQEIPNENGKCLITKDAQRKLINNLIMNVPREYIVIPSIDKVTFLNCSGKNISINTSKSI